MTLQEQLRADMVAAMKAKEDLRLTTLRSVIALCTQELTATKRTPQDTLSDEEVLGLIRRAVKQRTEAAAQFRAGGRNDLAENEEKERLVLETYLPAQLSREELERVVRTKMEEQGAVDKSTAGKLIGAVMAEVKGHADGAQVKQVVETLIR